MENKRMIDQHVIPLEDLLPHNTDEDGECRCDPDVVIVGGVLVYVHHSYDGREEGEER